MQARLFVADTESEALQQAASAREKMPPFLVEHTIAGTRNR
ncbi:hypothetical protein ACYT84_18680 [Ralstonia solanacearum]|nr:hypothetical protein [Ralstonia solanacearum]